MRREFVFVLVLPWAASGSVWVVPGVVSQSTSGSVGTDIRVLNQGATPTNATFDLLPAAGAAAPASVTQSILPGQTLLLPNVLAALWSLADGAGTLRITADQPLAITGLVTRTAAAGTLSNELRPMIAGHFVYRSGRTLTSAAGRFQTPVDVRGPHPTLSVTSQAATFGGKPGYTNLNTVTVTAAQPVQNPPSTAVGHFGTITYSARNLNDTAWEITQHAEAVNNQPEGSTFVSLSGNITFPGPGPVPVDITLMSAASSRPFTDLVGNSNSGQATVALGGTLRCNAANMNIGNTQAVGPGASSLPTNYSFGPSTVHCDNISTFNFLNSINGFVGGFTGDITMRIELTSPPR